MKSNQRKGKERQGVSQMFSVYWGQINKTLIFFSDSFLAAGDGGVRVVGLCVLVVVGGFKHFLPLGRPDPCHVRPPLAVPLPLIAPS
jgi:hypothetical protein